MKKNRFKRFFFLRTPAVQFILPHVVVGCRKAADNRSRGNLARGKQFLNNKPGRTEMVGLVLPPPSVLGQ